MKEITTATIDTLATKAMGYVITSPELAYARPWDPTYTKAEIELYGQGLAGSTIKLAIEASREVCDNRHDIPIVASVIQFKIATLSSAFVGTSLDTDTVVSCDGKSTVTIAAGNLPPYSSSDVRIVAGLTSGMQFLIVVSGRRTSQDYTSAMIRMLEAKWNRPKYTKEELGEFKALVRRPSKWATEILLMQDMFTRLGYNMFAGDNGKRLRAKLGNLAVDGFRNACLRCNHGYGETEYPRIQEVENQCKILLLKCAGTETSDISEAAATRKYSKR